jgi:hypothetical protein
MDLSWYQRCIYIVNNVIQFVFGICTVPLHRYIRCPNHAVTTNTIYFLRINLIRQISNFCPVHKSTTYVRIVFFTRQIIKVCLVQKVTTYTRTITFTVIRHIIKFCPVNKSTTYVYYLLHVKHELYMLLFSD